MALTHSEKALAAISNNLDNISKSVQRLEKGILSGPTTFDEPRTHSGNLVCQVPVELDWMNPPLKAEASFIRRVDGKITVVLEIEGEEAALVEDFIDRGFVEKLQVSLVAP